MCDMRLDGTSVGRSAPMKSRSRLTTSPPSSTPGARGCGTRGEEGARLRVVEAGVADGHVRGHVERPRAPRDVRDAAQGGRQQRAARQRQQVRPPPRFAGVCDAS
jgi:hypothetical protein